MSTCHYYAAQYDHRGKPHGITYYKFWGKSNRDWFVSAQHPDADEDTPYFREAIPARKIPRGLRWKTNRDHMGIAECTP